MTGRIDNKVCIVTGGAKSLGLAFTRALLAEGARVLAVDIADGSKAQAAGAEVMQADIAETGAAQTIATHCLDRFGRIDALVNNAAIFAALPTVRYDAIEDDLWDSVMRVNVTGTYRMIRAVAPHMESQGRGKIINLTSGTVYKGMPGMLHYITSKGAVQAMTRAVSRELGASGVCVNNLAPGLTLSDSVLEHPDHLAVAQAKVIDSRAIPRDGLPEDLLGALVFLCSEESNFVTGQTIAVDGGSINT